MQPAASTVNGVEWRPVPGWPNYEVSSQGRVRHVRYLTGNSLRVSHYGRVRYVTAQKFFALAFEQTPVAEGSMLRIRRPWQLWNVVRAACLSQNKNTADFEKIVRDVLANDKRLGVVRRDTRRFRTRLSHTLTQYVRLDLLTRPYRGWYTITDAGIRYYRDI